MSFAKYSFACELFIKAHAGIVNSLSLKGFKAEVETLRALKDNRVHLKNLCRDSVEKLSISAGPLNSTGNP